MWVQSTLVDLIRQLAVKKDPKLVCRHCQVDRYTLLTWSCSRGFLQQTEGLSSLTPSPSLSIQQSREEHILSPAILKCYSVFRTYKCPSYYLVSNYSNFNQQVPIYYSASNSFHVCTLYKALLNVRVESRSRSLPAATFLIKKTFPVFARLDHRINSSIHLS